jgi:NADPH-dependent 2,4-dienoyl-CoA reductase/sulfur reductase-like enzyme
LSERLVIIGGDAAGMSAAGQARRRTAPGALDVVVVERGRFTSYSACGIPYWIGGGVENVEALISRTPDEHRADGIDVRTRTEAVGIDLDTGTVTVADLDGGGEERLGFDQLLLATGSVPNRPDLPGITAANVHGVQVLDDGVALRARLAQDGVRRVVVIGGGYIGLEIAEAVKQRGLEVTVVDRASTPVGMFDPDIGEYISNAVRGLGIGLELGVAVIAIETSNGIASAVHTADGSVFPADVVVLGLGVRPNVALAAAAGIPVGTSGGLVVDRQMRTPIAGVWAAGDCVESRHRVSGQPVVVALGTHANKQGRIAGINLSGGYATFPGVIGTAVTKVCDWEVARTGLSSREATEVGYEFVTASIDSSTRAGYFPGSQPIRVKMLAERRSGRLLGAQIVGREGAAKRIDVLATAIWNEMPVDEVLNLDLSYAPPFAPVWDPVLVAARMAFSAVERDVADSLGVPSPTKS